MQMFIGFHLLLRLGGLIPSALKYFAVTSWDSVNQVLLEKCFMNCREEMKGGGLTHWMGLEFCTSCLQRQ